MDYKLDHFVSALNDCGAIPVIQSSTDIALVEYDGRDCRCSFLFCELLKTLGVDCSVVKKIFIHGKNRIQLRRMNKELESLFPNATFNYTGLHDVNRYTYGPIPYMLCVHFFPENSEGSIIGELGAEAKRFLYKINVHRSTDSTNNKNPFSVSVNTDLLSRGIPKAVPQKEEPKFCLERQESYDKLIRESYLSAALEQCLNEIQNGCEECPSASKYKDGHDCPYFQLKLAELYFNGSFVPNNDIIAFQWLKKSAAQGYPRAEYLLANCLKAGQGCEKNLNEAWRIYTKLAMTGDVESSQALAKLYDLQSPQGYRNLPWIARLAKSGDYEMQKLLVEQIYSTDTIPGISPNENQLSKWVDIAAESGNIECISSLAQKYEDNEDWENATKWLYRLQELDTETDYSQRINSLFVKTLKEKGDEQILKEAECYYEGIDTEVDYYKAYLCYSVIAETSSEALYGKARCIMFGRGTTKDEQLAEKLYEQSAEMGSVRGLYYMYKKCKDLDDNPWVEQTLNALDRGVENDNIFAILKKARLLIFPEPGLFIKDEVLAYQLYNKAMELGSVEAIREVGMCLCDGYGADKDYDKAQSLFRTAADRGMSTAMRCLGCTYRYGYGNVDVDLKAAIQWFMKAAEKNDGQSQYLLGKFYEKKDAGLSNNWYMRAAENGSSKAQAKMIEKLFYGNGVKKDLSLARKWGEQAAAEGEKDVYFRVAYMCCDGLGGPVDYSKAIKYYTILAEQNNAAAINNLAWMTECGKGVEKDQVKASEMFLKSANYGDRVAMRNIAQNYKNGSGIEKDYSKYLEWMDKGASSGNIQCMYELAVLYREGNSNQDIDKDIDKAVNYYESVISKASSDENHQIEYKNALMELANMYYYGEGVDTDDEKAFTLHRKAAEKCVTKAYYLLGEHYYHGYGTEENDRTAIYWYRKAAEEGYQDAKDKLDEIGIEYINEDGLPF